MKELDDTFHSLVDEDEVSHRVKEHLNEVFGKDAANLSKVVKLVEELRLARDGLQQRLQFATTEAPDKITKAVRGAERALAEGDQLTRRGEGLQEQAREHFEKVSSLLQKVGPGVRKVAELRRVETYQEFVSSVEEWSHDIASSLHIGAEGQALLGHSKLVESAKAIEGTQCHHLQAFVTATLLHWNKALLHRFTSEFEGVLKSIKWPLVGESSLEGHLLPATPDSLQRLCTLTHYLLQLSLQDLSVEESPPSPSVTPAVLTHFEPPLLPIQLMLHPLEVRFMYHFTGTRATNSRSHPEWYYIQLLKWVKAHDSFLTHRIQPVLDRCGKADVVAKMQFLRGLVRLAAIKVTSDLPHLQQDDDLFSATVQEALNFDRELTTVHGYPQAPQQPSILCVLADPQVFPRWLALERKFALEVMDELVSSDGAWEVEEWEGSCGGGGGVARCGEKVVLLLQGITDRYKALPQPGHRLQFLELQLELLDDFRVRLLQVMKAERRDPLTSHYPAILNTTHHLITTLGDWGDLPFFIEMQFYQESFHRAQHTITTTSTVSSPLTRHHQQDDSKPLSPSLSPQSTPERSKTKPLKTVESAAQVSGSVFDSTVTLYTHIEGEMVNTLSTFVFSEVRARSLPYRRDKWHKALDQRGGGSGGRRSGAKISEVSPSVCPLLEVLARHLHTLRDCLAVPLFHTLWTQVAETVDKYIYEELVLETRFTEAGALQFRFDMTSALFPIFGEFTQRPENYFRLIKESCILLTLPRPTVLLLQDTLATGTTSFVHPEQALADHGVTLLSPQEATAVINSRIYDTE